MLSDNRVDGQTLQSDTSLPRPALIDLNEEADAYLVSRFVKYCALELGIVPFEAASFANAASEVAMNAIIHGGGGRASIQTTRNRRGVEITVIDCGPGIGDLSEAFNEGYSTIGTLGVGLNAAIRACDEFNITANTENGTAVVLAKYRHIATHEIDYDVVSLPAEGSSFNRNLYEIQEFQGDTLVAVVADLSAIDQLDHQTKQLFRDAVSQSQDETLETLANRIQYQLKQRYRVVDVNLALLRIGPTSNDCHILGACQVASFAITTTNESTWTTVLASNGIDLSNARKPLYSDSSYGIATQLFNQCARPDKDATVMVVRIHNHESP